MDFTFTLDSATLRGNLHALPERIDRLVAAVMERQADVSTAYMKSNAPWTDRTGNARNGLHAVTAHSRGLHSVTLAHGVPYGIWLEVRWGGRFAIVGRAVQVGGVETMRLLEKGLSRL